MCGASEDSRARVEMAARRHDRMPGGHDAAAVHPARVDRLGQRDVEQVATGLDEQAEVAHRREPGEQRAAGIGAGAQRHLRRVGPHRIVQSRLRDRRGRDRPPCPSALGSGRARGAERVRRRRRR